MADGTAPDSTVLASTSCTVVVEDFKLKVEYDDDRSVTLAHLFNTNVTPIPMLNDRSDLTGYNKYLPHYDGQVVRLVLVSNQLLVMHLDDLASVDDLDDSSPLRKNLVACFGGIEDAKIKLFGPAKGVGKYFVTLVTVNSHSVTFNKHRHSNYPFFQLLGHTKVDKVRFSLRGNDPGTVQFVHTNRFMAANLTHDQAIGTLEHDYPMWLCTTEKDGCILSANPTVASTLMTMFSNHLSVMPLCDEHYVSRKLDTVARKQKRFRNNIKAFVPISSSDRRLQVICQVVNNTASQYGKKRAGQI